MVAYDHSAERAGPAARLPGDVARRVDSLARAAHVFHRFAHHPLCDRYEGEVVRLGRRTRVCRGCSLALAGAVAGAVAGLLLPVTSSLATALSAALAAAVLALAVRGRRRSKALTRALPAALAAALVFHAARHPGVATAAAAVCALASVAVALRAYRRRGPDRSACESCEERSAAVVCRGYRPIARRERAFARRAAAIVGGARSPATRPASASG